MASFFKKKYNRIDKAFPEIRIYELRELPIIYGQTNFDYQVDALIKNQIRIEEVNSGFLQLLQSKFDIEKPSTKLQHWSSLDFKGFLAELKKAKVPQLSLDQEAEWMEYFNKKKAEDNALQSEIDRIDKEIDQMVYQLYDLTAEEIAIVENN